MVKITVYDGYNTIGGNKIFVEYDEKKSQGVFLDFGMNFARSNNYFQEFLNPRVVRGIYDFLTLNLIPKLNIYREDLIPKDIHDEVNKFPKLNIDAVLISHAHQDHYGCIGLIDNNIPIIASPTTFALIKGISDTSSVGSLGTDVIIDRERYKVKEKKERILKQKKSILKRPLVSTQEITNEEFKEFLSVEDNSSLLSLDAFPIDISIKAFEVDHSIYGASAYILEGERTIAYTGDLRFHGKLRTKSEQFVDAAKGVDVLIIEGTRISGEDVFDSEDNVFFNCEKAAKYTKEGIVVADFSARNIERLETFKKIATNIDRELIINKKDAYILYCLKLADGIDRLKDVKVYNPFKGTDYNWEKYIDSKLNKGSLIESDKVKVNPEKYILCFSFYDMNKLLDIVPVGGSYIYSSFEAFETEMEFDFIRLSRWLQYFKLKPWGFKVEDNGELKFTKGFHASGHLSISDLEFVISEIAPKWIIPVHTNNPSWFKNNELFNNKVIKLTPTDNFKIP